MHIHTHNMTTCVFTADNLVTEQQHACFQEQKISGWNAAYVIKSVQSALHPNETGSEFELSEARQQHHTFGQKSVHHESARAPETWMKELAPTYIWTQQWTSNATRFSLTSNPRTCAALTKNPCSKKLQQYQFVSKKKEKIKAHPGVLFPMYFMNSMANCQKF